MLLLFKGNCSKEIAKILFIDISTPQHLVISLDMSNNQLTDFPIELEKYSALETLDLSRNHIDSIPAGVQFPETLRFLHLAQNNISNWLNINPNTVLHSAVNLHTLNLAGNPLRSFSSLDERLILTSNSLKILDLSECKVAKITGEFVLRGLVNLEHLILARNPLHSISEIISEKLLSLDLSDCKLSFLHKTVFSQMPQLTYVNLNRNHRLSLSHTENEFVTSISLRRIDLSLCNMDAVELHGFPNLTTAILRGNLINQLAKETFQQNPLLENLDLSSNAITRIASGAFRQLQHLKNLDLSYNMIRKIERETFKENPHLTSINLSRNYIERINRIASSSLTYLNVSWCEILNIDLDAFNDLPEMIELDLSNNLFNQFPATLHSKTLQILNLSTCR